MVKINDFDREFILKIFTKRQVEIIEKRLSKQEFTLTEKSTFYKAIKPKLRGIIVSQELAKTILFK